MTIYAAATQRIGEITRSIGLRRPDSVSVASLASAVAKERGDQLECIDVLLAATSFSAFVELMLDYKFGLYAEREISPGSVLEG